MDVVAATADRRNALADFFDGLDEEQPNTPSLCTQWSVREVLGHLVMPSTVGFGSLMGQIVRSRGSVDRASAVFATRLASRPVVELTRLLRDRAEMKGPRPMGQLVDACIHQRDCERPLGLAGDVELERWRAVLDWLPTRHAVGFDARGRIAGVSLR